MYKHDNYYDILKVTRDAPTAVIQAAFRALMQLHHPDNFEGKEDQSVIIALNLREACDILINPETRAQYDQWLDKESHAAREESNIQPSIPSKNKKAA
jgi:DnaJ-class molecular chaperone